MAKVKLNYENTNAMIAALVKMRSQTEDHYQTVKKAGVELEWKVAAAENIRIELAELGKRLLAGVKLMDEYVKALRETCDGFSSMEKGLSRKSNEMSYIMGRITFLMGIFTNPHIASMVGFATLRQIGNLRNMFGVGKKEEKSVMEGAANMAASGIIDSIAIKPDKMRKERVENLKNDIELSTQLAQKQIGHLCTSCSTATLLMRKQYIDGCEVTFGMKEVRAAMGSKPDGNGGYTDVSVRFDRTWLQDGDYTLKTTVEKLGTVKAHMREQGIGTYTDYFTSLLDERPEGIVIYCTENMKINPKNGEPYTHAIVLTDYSRSESGEITFYISDPAVNGGARTTLDKSIIKNRCNGPNTSNEDIFGHLSTNMAVWYLD